MTATQPETKLEVIKHSAAIQMEGNITLVQKRAWNVLLFNAYPELLDEEIHSIRVQDLTRILEFDSHNVEYLKEALEALVGCKVKWNLLDKDGSETWGVAALLASAEVKNGTCTYAFAAHLRPRLHNPRMYARINLTLQNRFGSKHAQTLWELCTDYLGAEREQGETSYIPLEQFRKLLGLENKEYAQQFKIFNRDVLKPAIAEINRVSDFRVTVDYHRERRKITALKFKIRRVAMLPHSKQPDLFPDLTDMPLAVKAMTDAGLPLKDALTIWQKGFEYVEPNEQPADIGDNPEHAFTRYVQEKIHLLQARAKTGKVENPAGYLLTLLKKNYTSAALEKQEAAKGVAVAQRQKTKELRELKAQKEKIERERDEVMQRACDKVIEAFPEMAERAVAILKAENNAAFRHCYDPEKTPVENYKNHRFIAGAVGQWLESQLPKDFEQKKKPYSGKLDALDARIKALEGEGIKA
jgi:hypothetical protein